MLVIALGKGVITDLYRRDVPISCSMYLILDKIHRFLRGSYESVIFEASNKEGFLQLSFCRVLLIRRCLELMDIGRDTLER